MIVAGIIASVALSTSPIVDVAANAKIEMAHCHEMANYYDAQGCVEAVYEHHRFDNAIPTCEFEDSANCVWLSDWDGKSYVDWEGVAYYMPHVYILNT